jgi:hypothetical protein
MTELTPNAFIGWPKQPTDAELAAALGATKAIWDRLIAELAAEHAVDVRDWNCYSAKAGWSLRLKRGKRAIVYLAPCSGCFRAAFVLGDKAVEAARRGKLSKRLIQMLDQAERYPEGTAIRIEVRSPRDIAAIKKLAILKLEN